MGSEQISLRPGETSYLTLVVVKQREIMNGIFYWVSLLLFLFELNVPPASEQCLNSG
jgi:hypothetical protein